MNGLKEMAIRFVRSEEGPTAVEYAVMLALIIAICLAVIEGIGTDASTKLSSPELIKVLSGQ